MAFKRTTTGGADYSSPGELYRDLPRRPGAVPGLWAHQSEMLKTYTANADAADVALELPTGTGKTLTGLLIAEWTRRKRRARVIYACPTRQLARQVASAAYREGIDVSVLIGAHADWPGEQHTAYEAAGAVAVSTYSSIFNTNPHLAEADLILFDDAHAGEQYVGEAYSVELERRAAGDAYRAAIEAVSPALDDVFVERLLATEPDASIGKEVRLVVPLRQPGMLTGLSSVLGSLDAPYSYRYAMISSAIESCLVYVAYSGLLVRPYVPPTYQNPLFANARQRVYLSATLGEGGELERAFGRPGIVRLEQPDESTSPRYGRRFFVFPQSVETAQPEDLSRAIVAEAGKALVLAPKHKTAMASADALAQPTWPRWGIDQVHESMSAFAELENGVCGLAARYDGLDLPGDACRVVALDGVPDQQNLQERFLQSKARAGAALASRVRTRVVQGAGRCTRGPGDLAIVLVLGSDLTRYLNRPEVISALDPELQAEIRFGFEHSQKAEPEEVLSNVRAFLNQASDDSWRADAEPILTDYRHEMDRQLPPGSHALASCVEHEIRAWVDAASGAWEGAAQHAHEVARLVGVGGSDTSGYRAFWLYLEAVWTDHAAAQAGDAGGRAAAASLVESAVAASGLGSWIRQLAPLPDAKPSALSAVDAYGVRSIAARLDAGVNQGKLRAQLQRIDSGLRETDPGSYEPALTELGSLTGALALKPEGSGRCDSTWCWDNHLWLALEAKSDHLPTGVVPHKDVRQANDQLRLLAADRSVDVPPIGSATVIISPKPGVHDDGVIGAEAHVHLARPSALIELAHDINAAWEELLAKNKGRSPTELVALVETALNGRGVLPSQIHERLTTDPLNRWGESHE